MLWIVIIVVVILFVRYIINSNKEIKNTEIQKANQKQADAKKVAELTAKISNLKNEYDIALQSGDKGNAIKKGREYYGMLYADINLRNYLEEKYTYNTSEQFGLDEKTIELKISNDIAGM
jgi:hypothetical protein